MVKTFPNECLKSRTYKKHLNIQNNIHQYFIKRFNHGENFPKRMPKNKDI